MACAVCCVLCAVCCVLCAVSVIHSGVWRVVSVRYYVGSTACGACGACGVCAC